MITVAPSKLAAVSEARSRAARRERYLAHRVLRSRSLRKGAAICMTPAVGQGVEISVHESGQATTAGLRHCGSLLGCPVCAETGLRTKAGEIDRIVKTLIGAGYVAVFLTCTVQHSSKVPLDWSFRALRKGWERAFSGRALRKAGYVGAIKALDDTWSAKNGWHPHFHAVLLFDNPDREAVATWLHDRFDVFRAGVRKAGLDTRRNARVLDPATGRYRIENVGWDVKFHRDGDDWTQLVEYEAGIGKIDAAFSGNWSLGREVAEHTAKRKGVNHWMILRAAVTGEVVPGLEGMTQAQLWELWSEWEKATKGRSAVRISKELGALARVEIKSDELAAVGEDDTTVVYVETFTASQWMRNVVEPGRIAEVIHHAIDRARAAGLIRGPSG